MTPADRIRLTPDPYANMYSPTTHLISEALEAAKKQQAIDKRAFINLRDHLSEWPHKKALDSVFVVYHKQFHAPALQHYGLIIQAAKQELQSDQLPLRDRVKLLAVMDTAAEKLLEISQIFSDILTDLPIKEEILDQIIAEEQSLMEANLEAVENEIKKNGQKIKKVESELTDIAHKIEFLGEEIARLANKKEPSPQKAELNANSIELRNARQELELLRKEKFSASNREELNKINHKIEFVKGRIAEIKSRQRQLVKSIKIQNKKLEKELDKLKARQAELQKELGSLNENRKVLGKIKISCAEKLNKFHGNIAEHRAKVQKQFETSESVQEVVGGISSGLGAGVAGLVEEPAVSAETKKEIAAAGFQAIANVAMAKTEHRITVAKKEASSVLKKVAIAVIGAVGSAIIGAIVGAAISNPVTFAIVGGAVAVFAIGIYVIRNKPYFIKLMSYPKAAINFVAKGIVHLYNMIKNRISPNIQIESSRIPLSEDSGRRIEQLRHIVNQATNSAEKAKCNDELRKLWGALSEARKQLASSQDLPPEKIKELQKNIEDLQEQIKTKNEELAALDEEAAQIRSFMTARQEEPRTSTA